jgi:crossover junction endodeoxyribonuclease RuvC
MVAVEGPSYHSIGGMRHERAGLWWAIVGRLSALGLPVAEVPPTVAKLWATGKGNASKREVLTAVGNTFRGVDIPDHNCADALALAALAGQRIGLLGIGRPHHVVAGRGVRWPG